MEAFSGQHYTWTIMDAGNCLMTNANFVPDLHRDNVSLSLNRGSGSTVIASVLLCLKATQVVFEANYMLFQMCYKWILTAPQSGVVLQVKNY